MSEERTDSVSDEEVYCQGYKALNHQNGDENSQERAQGLHEVDIVKAEPFKSDVVCFSLCEARVVKWEEIEGDNR